MDDQHLAVRRGPCFLDQPLSRRRLLRGLAGPTVAGAALPLGAACTPQQPPAKPAETTPVAPPATAGAPAPKVETKPAGGAKPGEQPKQGGTLKIALLGEPPALDTMFTTATITRLIGFHWFETLFAPNEKQEPEAFLAEKYEASSDAKNWSFTLRKGIQFHDGKEMTADDVVASLKRWGSIGARGKVIFGRLDTIDAKDKYTVRMTFKQPTGATLLTFLSEGSAFVMPEELAKQLINDKLTDDTKYVGTGPYQFLEHQADRFIRMKRWDKYMPLEKPASFLAGKRVAYVDEITMIPVPEGSVRADGVGTGEYHFADSLQPDQYDTVKGQANVSPIIVKPYYWVNAVFNNKEGLLKDIRLRRAVTMSLSMEPIAKAAVGRSDFYRLGPELAAPETTWYNDEGKDIYDHPDPDKAKALMKEAGYDGTPLRWMSTKEYFYNYNGSLAIKQQLEAVGFKLDLQVMDWATLVKRRSDPKEYDAFVTAQESYTHPVLKPYLTPSWPGFWENEERDKLVAQIFAEPDSQKVNGLIRQLQALQWREVPNVRLCEYFLLESRHNELKGFGNPPDWFFWNCWLG